MAQSRHHYERSFEAYLRSRCTPYVSVNEARRALLPPKTKLAVETEGPSGPRKSSLKSFDFVIYGSPHNLLVEIKGRRVGRSKNPNPATRGQLQSWVTLDDITALDRWQRLFGTDFRATFVFVYWCDQQPPDALFQEVFEHEGRWFAVRSVLLDDYREHMVTRSAKWGTVHIPSASFERISRPLSSAAPGAPGEAGSAGVPHRVSAAPRLQRELRRSLERRLAPQAPLSGHNDQPIGSNLPAGFARTRPGR